MATARACIIEAMRALRALAPGEEPDIDELTDGLGAVQAIVLEIHEARGALMDVDVVADVVPSENQRIRVQAGSTVNVTLPNSIQMVTSADPYDYGFRPGLLPAPVGSTAPADGYQTRAPRDGARIEVVGTTQALYFYRADINAWQAATGLTLDAEMPLNARYASHLASLVAERLLDVVGNGQMTPALGSRLARARTAIYVRPGVARDPVIAEYY